MEAENCKNEYNPQPPKVAIHLEIGDWVYQRSKSVNRLSPPMYVVGLWDDGAYLEIDREQGDPFEAEYDEIEGIPLTKDIVEKNGLQTFILVEYTQFIFVCNRERFRVRYVHELQHIMRLCHIDIQIKL